MKGYFFIDNDLLWYKYTAAIAANTLPIVGNNLIVKGKENSASIKVIWLGWINKLFPKKSVPTPTNKSAKINPKKILAKDNKNKGIITLKLA